VSQLDRQKAYAKAKEQCDELVKRVNDSAAAEKQKSRMIDALTAMWVQADLACGGEECRP
jgi:hypothetical protein